MAEDVATQSLAERIANDLSACRQRGLDDLELRTHNQEPRSVPDLEHLARAYHKATGVAAHGRVAEIRTLLQAGLATYAEQGNQAESQFIGRLFFDISGEVPKKRPGTLLDEAKRDSGLDSERFAEYRRMAFIQFAAFLIDFVAAAHDVPAPQPAPATTAAPALTPRHRWPLLAWVSVVVAGLVVASGVFVATFLLTGHRVPGSGGTGHSPVATATHSTSGSYVPGRTYTEIAGQFGTPTFKDPHSLGQTGPRVEPYQQVQVACKVFAPTIPSASPDGYWYRITSPPWNGTYYGAANTFLNGDKPGQSTHNTDFAVPNCPA